MTPKLDIQRLRAEFPMLGREMNGRPLVYLDSAATALKPRPVIDALTRFYEHDYGTVRRGIYSLSQEATARFEAVRERARGYLGAASAAEIVFVRGVTEGINLVASSYGGAVLKPGDEVLITELEHHANIVPWQLACQRSGAKLVVAPIDDGGQVQLDRFRALLGPRTKIAAFVHLSNAIGTLNPAKEMIAMARAVGARVLLDAAQSAAHMPVDVRDLDCDFLVCSGHKMFGPTGAGLLYAKGELLADMPPWQGGGEMIDTVTFEETTFNEPPYRFEAGTPAIAEIIGLGAALEWIDGVGRAAMRDYEHALTMRARERLLGVPGVHVFGPAEARGPITSFVMEGISPFDVGTLLDQQGVAVRVGTHCAQPLLRRFGQAATVRASFAIYNTQEDVDRLIEGLGVVRRLMA